MSWTRVFVVVALVFVSSLSHAYFDISPDKTRPKVMNDIDFEKYQNFPQEWHLVTVRYRVDSKEMRLIYANDIAWEAMKNFKPVYPDGAIFGKVGMLGEPDPGFPSSVVPAGGRRYQFMVKDKVKYKATEGWGYALFDASGKRFNDDVKNTTLSCAACHRIVPERDYIFARKMNLLSSSTIFSFEETPSKAAQLFFETKKRSSLPESVQKRLAPSITEVNEVGGDLKKNAFSGTLDEIVPLLMIKTKETLRPSGLFIDKLNYSIVMPNPTPIEECNLPGGAVTVVVVFNGKPVRNSELCQ